MNVGTRGAEGSTGPSKVAAAVAACLPVAAGVAGVAVLAVAAASMHGIGEMFHEVGGLAVLVLVLTVVGALAAGALLLIQGLGLRVPTALPIGAAALPWIGGAGAMMALVARVDAALGSLGSAEVAELESLSGAGTGSGGVRAELAIRGIAEAANARVMGCILGGALLAATAVGLGVVSIGQRAPGRRLAAAAAGAGSGLFFLIGAIVAAAMGRLGVANILFVLPALAAVAALGLAGAGAGADAPHGRSSALAAAAPVAAGLAFVAGASAAVMVGEIQVLAALAGSDAGFRPDLVAGAASEIAPAAGLERWGAGLAFVPAATLAAWAASRIRPSLGRVAGAVGAVLVAALVLVVDGQSVRSALSTLESATATPWREAAGFEPVRIEGEAREVVADAVVGLDAVLPRQGAAVPVASLGTPAGRVALAGLFASLLREPARPGPRAPAWMQPPELGPEELDRSLDDEEGGKGKRHKGDEGWMGARKELPGKRYAIRGPEDNPDPHLSSIFPTRDLGIDPRSWLAAAPSTPTLSLAIDARLPADALRSVLEAAQAAGARSVRAIGAPPGSPTSAAETVGSESAPLAATWPTSAERIEDVRAKLPLLGALASGGQRSFLFRLERWLPEAFADRDEALLHATVRDAGPLSLEARAGSRFQIGSGGLTIGGPGELVVGPRGSPPRSFSHEERDWLQDRLAYLSLGPGVTAGMFLDAADRVAAAGPVPLAVLGPSAPGHPDRDAPSPGALADLPGGADALGALMGDQIGDAFGYGGLGLRGAGRGGGGTGEGTIGLGNLGTIGHGSGGGSGSGYGRGTGGLRGRSASVPTIRLGTATVRGGLSKEVVRRIVRSHMNELKFCYEQQLSRQPSLEGRVTVNFVVSGSGSVQSAVVAGSTLGNATAEGCMARAVKRWAFPAPEGGGIVVVTYPIMLQAASGLEEE